MLYWDIPGLFSELTLGLLKTRERYKSVESVSLSTWGVDFGFIDKNG